PVVEAIPPAGEESRGGRGGRRTELGERPSLGGDAVQRMRNRDRDQDRPGAGNRSEAGRGHRRARATQGAAKPDGGPPRRPGEDRGQRGPLRGGADPISARGVPGGGLPVDVRERSGGGDHGG